MPSYDETAPTVVNEQLCVQHDPPSLLTFAFGNQDCR